MTDQNDQRTIDNNNKHNGRKWAVGLLITLGLVFLVVANIALWAYFTLINTHGWVAAVGPLSKDPAIANLTSQYVVAQVFEQAGFDQTVEEALPEELQLFSGPLVVGLEQVADNVVTTLVLSDAFNNIWVAFNRVSHTAIMDVLKGKGDRLYFQAGNLTLDFNDIYNFIQDRLGIGELDLIPQAKEWRLVLFSSRQVAVMQWEASRKAKEAAKTED